MDELVGLFEGPRARGAFLVRASMAPPWSIRVQDGAALTVIVMTGGHASVAGDGWDARELSAGDVAIMRGPGRYLVADSPGTPPQVLIEPGQRCTTLRGEGLAGAMDLGVRTWGSTLDGPDTMLVGTYEHVGAVGRRLLDALPEVLVLPGAASDSRLIPMLAEEIVKDEAGQEIVLDRLLDLLLIAVLRAWFARPDVDAPAWYRAGRDPVVGRAVRMLQNHPARRWTVAGLAAEIGISRAALARRFTEQLGEPPMAFLTAWRIALAADLLLEADATVAAVARKVGYSSPFALSTAFKRIRGVSPRDHMSTRQDSPLRTGASTRSRVAGFVS